MGYRIVVVGATGNVGREMLNILAEREFPADEVAAAADGAPAVDVVPVEGADHALAVRRSGPVSQEDTLALVTAEVRRFLRRTRTTR